MTLLCKPRAEKCLPMSSVGRAPLRRARSARCWVAICIVATCFGLVVPPILCLFVPTDERSNLYAAPPAVTGPVTGRAAHQPRSASQHLLVRIPAPLEASDGSLVVEPSVQVFDGLPDVGSSGAAGPFENSRHGGANNQGRGIFECDNWLDRLRSTPTGTPMVGTLGDDSFQPCDPVHCPEGAEPVFQNVLADLGGSACQRCGPLSIFNPENRSADIGIGRDRLMFAPFEMDSSQPSNNTLFRLDFAKGFPTPDRAEYFWAKPRNATLKGKGPELLEREVDYIDFRFRTEIGGEKFSAITEMSLRSLDPVHNENTTGMGDMSVATKTVMLDGDSWQLTQIFRTYMPTGAFGKGLGTGHVSLEPGVLATYLWRPTTLIHQELKYWFPVGGDPVHSGQVLRYGLGYSHLVHETDAFAVIHTCEFVGHWFLDGGKAVSSVSAIDIDGEPALQIYPGMRFVADTGGDFGLVEFGYSGTFSVGGSSLFDSFLRFDLRFSY